MTLTWLGTEFSMTGVNAPTLPYSVSLEQQGEIMRTNTGNSYLNLIWTKSVFSFKWDRASLEVGTLLKAFNKSTSPATLECDAGTYTVKMIDFDVQENGYNQVNASVTLREV
jgi:hypothetical protein